MTRTLRLIGAPTDIGASTRGAGMGPDALRVAGLAHTLASLGFEVIDGGNLAGPGTPWEVPAEGLHHLPEVIEWNRLVHDAVDQALQARQLPVLLGGGIPLLPSPGPRLTLALRQHRLYAKTGTLFVEYDLVSGR